MFALLKDRLAVKALMVVIMFQDKGIMESVIRMVVISTLIAWEIDISLDLAPILLPNLLQFITANGMKHEDFSEIRR
jgi:hypothetical protein